tara:strand:- start:11 stop:259 length:249 start_codon:yes stop_codon:yes gene_type:complete
VPTTVLQGGFKILENPSTIRALKSQPILNHFKVLGRPRMDARVALAGQIAFYFLPSEVLGYDYGKREGDEGAPSFLFGDTPL